MQSYNALPIEWVKRLWQRFSDAYGRPFTMQFSTEEQLASWRETWSEGLAGLSAEHIAYGLKAMALSESAFAPSLGEFGSWCRAFMPAKAEAVAASHVPPSAETIRKFRQTVASVALAAPMRWWTPERVVNESQVAFICVQAARFGPQSTAAEFLAKCIEAGVITEDLQLAAKIQRQRATVDDDGVIAA